MIVHKINGVFYLIKQTRGHSIGRELDITTLPQYIQDRVAIIAMMEVGDKISPIGERTAHDVFEVNHTLIGEKS